MATKYYSGAERPYERYHLTFSPSNQLAELVSPLYKPSMQHKAGQAAIKSLAFLDLEVLSGRRLIYRQDSSGSNEIEKVLFYQKQLEQDVKKRPLAIVAFTNLQLNQHSGDLRLHLKVAPSPRDRIQISALPEFALPSEDPVLDVYWNLPSADRVDSTNEVGEVYADIKSNLGVNHPAASKLPYYKKPVSEWLYVDNTRLTSDGRVYWV
jgi:hypothetical protein